MIKISQVKTIQPYANMEKLSKCIEFTKKDKNFKCSIVTHDAYKLKVIRYDNDLLTVIGPEGKEDIKMNDFIKKYSLVYHQARYNEAISTVDSLLNNYYSEKDSTDFVHVVLFIPKDLLEVLNTLQEKVGLEENDFFNFNIVPILENVFTNIDDRDNYKDFSRLSALSIIMEATSVNFDYKEFAPTYRSIFTGLIYALIDDTITKLINKGVEANRRKYEILEAADTIVNNYVVGCLNAFEEYQLKGNKEKLEALYNNLLRNAHKYGLSTYVMINKIENIINGFGSNIWSNKNVHTNYLFDGIDKLFLPAGNTLTYGESGYEISRAIEAIPGAIKGMDTSHLIGSSFVSVAALDNKNIDPVVVSVDDNNTVDKIIDNTSEPTGIHAVHFRRFLDRMEIYKQAKTFENNEERLKMVNKMLSLIDDISNTKKSFTRTSQFLTSNVKEINLSIYDLLLDDAKEHVNYLNNIKYYGTDNNIEQLNDNNYIGKITEGNGESQNFNWLSVPVEYFLGPDIATGRDITFGERFYDYGYDDNYYDNDNGNGRKAIFGGKGGAIHNFKRNVLSKNIYDRNGKLIRNSRDRIYYNGTNDNNMTKREVRELERVMIGRGLRKFGGTTDSLFDAVNVFKWGIWKLESFTSGLLFVLNEILGQLTFGLVYFEDGIERSNYNGNVLINLDNMEMFDEAYRNTLIEHYQGSNQEKTFGDKLDDGLYALGRGAKKLSKGVFKTALVTGAAGKALINKVTKKNDDDFDQDYMDNRNSGKSGYVKHKLIFIDKIVNPVLSLYNKVLGNPIKKTNRFIMGLFNKKPILDKFYDDANVVVDKILVGMQKDDNYTEEDINIIKKLKSNLGYNSVQSNKESFDVYGMDLYGIAYGESFDLNGINVVELKNKISLNNEKDVKDMIIRIFNTIKENTNVAISTVSIIQEMDNIYVFLRAKNGYIVFDVSNAYEGNLDTINISNITLGKSKIVINYNDLDPNTVDKIISGKILLAQNKKDKRMNEQIEDDKEMTEEDIRNEAIRKLELDTLKKLNEDMDNEKEE